jgi:tripartite-type tricarboxylate transporter receptor subunit TctC
MHAMIRLAALVAGCCFATAALGQSYPTKPVRVVVPFVAGGGPDVVGRVVGGKLAELWAQPVTVENLTGGGGTVGPGAVAKSPADGYTLLVSSSAQAISAATLTNLPYDPLKDFVPIASLARQPYFVVVSTSSGIKSLGGLISTARAKPGEIKFSSAGAGTATHLGAEKLGHAAAFRAGHVAAAGGTNPALEVVAGRATFFMSPLSLAAPLIRDGKLVALAMTGDRRERTLPEVPTVAESGVPGFEYTAWMGMWAPAGTPAAVVDRIAQDVARVLAAPDVQAAFAKVGNEPLSMPQAEFARFVTSESESAGRLLKAAAARAQ